MNKLQKVILVLFIFIIVVVGIQIGRRFVVGGSREVLIKSWEGYKKFFFTWEGRIIRKKEDDTTSDAQALAMLRAVWMNDSETFGKLYAWTERNLARSGLHSGMRDHLLAWKYEGTEITDPTPNLGADIDYALALILADRRWPDARRRVGISEPAEKARLLLADILKYATYRTLTGRLYLAPWPIDKTKKLEQYPINPSHYSPAHFKIFYEFTGDERWMELTRTAYELLTQLADGSKNIGSIGLFPDFCAVNNKDEIEVLESFSFDFGWEAVKIPYRLILDYTWFNSSQAQAALQGYAQFFREQWKKNKGVIYCEYTNDGQVMEKYEDALFYGSYYLAFRMLGYPQADEVLEKIRTEMMKRYDEKYIFWEDEYAYLANGFIYMIEGLQTRIIRRSF